MDDIEIAKNCSNLVFSFLNYYYFTFIPGLIVNVNCWSVHAILKRKKSVSEQNIMPCSASVDVQDQFSKYIPVLIHKKNQRSCGEHFMLTQADMVQLKIIYVTH